MKGIQYVAAGLALMVLQGPAQAGDLLGGLGRLMDGERDIGDVVEVVEGVNKAFAEPSREDELVIGREAAAILLGAVPAVENREAQRYVNRVGRWVARHTERPNLPWRFVILDSPDINAFAAPGGYVFITRGLLLQMESEAELAGVLAHETVHVLERHHMAAVQQGARLDLAIGVVGNSVNREQREQVAQIANGFKDLYARGLDKDDEFAADRKGVVIATRAGYDPYGLPAVLQTLAAMNPADSSLAFLFKTHPAPQERLERLAPAFDGLEAYAGELTVAERFQRNVGVLR